MRRRLIVLSLLGIVLFPGILSLGIRQLPFHFQPSLNSTERLYSTVIIKQDFQALDNGLSAIGMSIKNPNLKNKKDLALKVYNLDGGLVRSTVVNGSIIPDGDFVRFKFPPVSGSKGLSYNLVLSADDTNEDEAYGIFKTDSTPSFLGSLIVNNQETPDKISLVTFYQPPTPLHMMFAIYKTWFNKLVSDLPFFVFYALALLICPFLLVRPKKVN